MQDLKQLSYLYDFSNLKPGHELYNTCNKGKSGVFKLEALDIKEFVGSSPKLYSYILADDKTGEKKCKGGSKSVVKRSITHQDYVKTVKKMSSFLNVEMHLIKSINQQLYYQTITKLCLSNLELKRYVLPNGIDTLAFGHVKIQEFINSTNYNYK